MKMLKRKNIQDSTVKSILEVIYAKSKHELNKENIRRKVRVENVMAATYMLNPRAMYHDCREAARRVLSYPDITTDEVRNRAEDIKLTEHSVTKTLAAWALEEVLLIYEAMSGNEEALATARSNFNSGCPDLSYRHPMLERFVLAGIFNCIPEFAETDGKEHIIGLGRTYSRMAIRSILECISFDLENSRGTSEPIADISALRREVYLARRELQEYREIVEAADAEFENKLEELTSREIVSFFSRLNNEKYGYLIDSLYLQKRACAEAKKLGEVTYRLEGIPVFLDRLMSFLRDAGIAPAAAFAPGTLQRLTLGQMEGCAFEPSPGRKKPITEDELIRVRVISSGWRLGDKVISLPVFQEEGEEGE